MSLTEVGMFDFTLSNTLVWVVLGQVTDIAIRVRLVLGYVFYVPSIFVVYF